MKNENSFNKQANDQILRHQRMPDKVFPCVSNFLLINTERFSNIVIILNLISVSEDTRKRFYNKLVYMYLQVSRSTEKIRVDMPQSYCNISSQTKSVRFYGAQKLYQNFDHFNKLKQGKGCDLIHYHYHYKLKQ